MKKHPSSGKTWKQKRPESLIHAPRKAPHDIGFKIKGYRRRPVAWNGLKHYTKMKRLPAQTLLGAQPGSGTQPCYKVSTDHWVKNG